MPGTTSPDNLVYPLVGDNVSPRVGITQLADSTQAALTNMRNGATRQNNFYGLSANINSTDPAPKLGDTYRESDLLKRLWIYDGSNWVTNENGSYLIRPTTVNVGGAGATASIDSTGQVNFTAVPAGGSITLDGIFTPRFNDYTLVCRYKFTTDGGFSLVLRGGGADRGGTNYRYAILRTDGTTSSGTSSSIPVGGNVGSHFYTQIDIHDPMVVEATSYQIRTGRSNTAAVHSTEFNSGLYAVSGLDDGISFRHTAGTGAVTGHIKIYGRA